MSITDSIGVTFKVARSATVPRVRREPLSWHVQRARTLGPLALFMEWFRHDTALRRSRRALRELSPEQLRDVGLTREEALAEAGRSAYLD